VRPELVVEVRYDKVQSNRFRHGTKLIRFRDDKNAAQCTWHELRPPVGATDSVASLLTP
jgi:ATP-dependent DNA ligase